MRVRSRLTELMAERGITVEALRRTTGVGAETVAALRKNTGQQVSYKALGNICAMLNVTLDQLFELIPEEIWAPIWNSREVTIHYGSRAVEQKRGRDQPRLQIHQYIGVWDQRAMNLITEYLRRSGSDIRVRQVEHVAREGRGATPEVRSWAERIFEEGNHIVIGSPIANPIAEEVVCRAYDVPSYMPDLRDRFPYAFAWEDDVISSFGRKASGSRLGVVSTATDKLVAPRTTVINGEGQDCAVIVVDRVLAGPRGHRIRRGEERVVIALLGHTGAGTYAAAELATHPAWSRQLYPRHADEPFMRAVTAVYASTAARPARDTREVRTFALVPETDDRAESRASKSGTRGGRPHATGSRSRRR